MTKPISFLLLIGLATALTGCLPFGTVPDQKPAQPNTNLNSNNPQPANQNSAPQPSAAQPSNEGVNEILPEDLTSSWKTNLKPLSLPISYKYPADWSIGKKGDINTGAVNGPKNNPIFEVTEEKEYAGLSSKDAAEKDGTFTTINSRQAIVIGGREAYMIIGQSVSGDQTLGLEKIYIADDNKIYSLKFLDWEQSDITSSPYYQTYQEILTTFSFTK